MFVYTLLIGRRGSVVYELGCEVYLTSVMIPFTVIVQPNPHIISLFIENAIRSPLSYPPQPPPFYLG